MVAPKRVAIYSVANDIKESLSIAVFVVISYALNYILDTIGGHCRQSKVKKAQAKHHFSLFSIKLCTFVPANEVDRELSES